MITVADTERLVNETFEHLQKNYGDDRTMARWATDRKISEAAFHHIIQTIGMLMLDDVKNMLIALAESEPTIDTVQDCFNSLQSGAALGLILGLELERQLLRPKTDLLDVFDKAAEAE